MTAPGGKADSGLNGMARRRPSMAVSRLRGSARSDGLGSNPNALDLVQVSIIESGGARRLFFGVFAGVSETPSDG